MEKEWEFKCNKSELKSLLEAMQFNIEIGLDFWNVLLHHKWPPKKGPYEKQKRKAFRSVHAFSKVVY